MTKTIPDEVMQKFSHLTSRLSPENLHCDGEISKSQAMVRYRQIMHEWKALEKECGRKVDEDEVWNWQMAKWEK
jgi:hypothetical protein